MDLHMYAEEHLADSFIYSKSAKLFVVVLRQDIPM